MKSEQSMSQKQKGSSNSQIQLTGDKVNSQPDLYDQQLKHTSHLNTQLEKEKEPDQDKKNENIAVKDAQKKHAPHLDEELKMGTNTAWNSACEDCDSNNEVKELAKAGKAKKKHTSSYHEIESEETRNRRIKQQAEAGEAF